MLKLLKFMYPQDNAINSLLKQKDNIFVNY